MAVFEINEPDVVAETIDAEAIVINLDRGVYYSIRGIGLVVWTDVIDGVDSEKIVDRLKHCPGAGQSQVPGEVTSFVDRLLNEKLIRPRGSAANLEPRFAPGSLQYSPPAIEKYTDMEALLLLDPIHDVDESGWPRRAQ